MRLTNLFRPVARLFLNNEQIKNARQRISGYARTRSFDAAFAHDVHGMNTAHRYYFFKAVADYLHRPIDDVEAHKRGLENAAGAVIYYTHGVFKQAKRLGTAPDMELLGRKLKNALEFRGLDRKEVFQYLADNLDYIHANLYKIGDGDFGSKFDLEEYRKNLHYLDLMADDTGLSSYDHKLKMAAKNVIMAVHPYFTDEKSGNSADLMQVINSELEGTGLLDDNVIDYLLDHFDEIAEEVALQGIKLLPSHKYSVRLNQAVWCHGVQTMDFQY